MRDQLRNRLRSFWQRKWLRNFCLLTLVVLSLYLCRYPIARSMGNFLIREDALVNAEMVFVLGGDSKDRAAEAARLYHKGYANRFFCTSEYVPSIMEVLDTVITESELTKIHLEQLGVPTQNILAVNKATSTKEEAEVILAYCQEQGFKNIIVLSSKFHLRRINYVFRDLFEEAGIELHLHGAPSSRYNEALWWQDEAGLLMVNNEYVKLVYYWLKY